MKKKIFSYFFLAYWAFYLGTSVLGLLLGMAFDASLGVVELVFDVLLPVLSIVTIILVIRKRPRKSLIIITAILIIVWLGISIFGAFVVDPATEEYRKVYFTISGAPYEWFYPTFGSVMGPLSPFHAIRITLFGLPE
jgi:nicotinamide riboside transporter PnuC